jgi:hypothetical protein
VPSHLFAQDDKVVRKDATKEEREMEKELALKAKVLSGKSQPQKAKVKLSSRSCPSFCVLILFSSGRGERFSGGEAEESPEGE